MDNVEQLDRRGFLKKTFRAGASLSAAAILAACGVNSNQEQQASVPTPATGSPEGNPPLPANPTGTNNPTATFNPAATETTTPAAGATNTPTGTSVPTATNSPAIVPAITAAETQTPNPTDTQAIPAEVETPSATANPTAIPLMGKTWGVQSVDSMKETKDRVKSDAQRDNDFINRWLDAAADLGVTHITVDTPFDNPAEADSSDYARRWITPARQRGLGIWHRHPFLAYEGIYDSPKHTYEQGPDSPYNYPRSMGDAIRNNPDMYAAGDIFGSPPEPSNGGINGRTYCPGDVCIYPNPDNFNLALISFVQEAQKAFADIRLGGKVTVGWFGFDGFVTAGLDNPDWLGKSTLSDTAVQAMGDVISIDHYPEDSAKMPGDLETINTTWPGKKLAIGEWGATHGEGPDQVRAVFESFRQNPAVIAVNYWHLGMGGKEALIDDDFSRRPNFAVVRSFFRSQG